MRFIKQYGRDAGQFRIVKQGGNEDRLGHDQHPGGGRTLAIKAGEIADRLPDGLAHQFGHPLCRCPRCHPAR